MVENKIKYLPSLGKSDHEILEFILKLYTDRIENQQQKRIYFNGNYGQINENLSQINWDKNFVGKTTTASWKSFSESLYKEWESNTPVCNAHRKRDTSWMTPKLSQL